MPGRTFSNGQYRYGFQGQELDNEVKGGGNSVNYKYRMHDPRIARFFATDPLEPKYPYLTPYQFSSNQPIHAPELEGLESAEELGHSAVNPRSALHFRHNAGLALEAAQSSGLMGVQDGLADAFRHSFWNALNTVDRNAEKAKLFAEAHETSSSANNPNSDDYDPRAVFMDHYNNYIGIKIGQDNPNASESELAELVLEKVEAGELLVMVGDVYEFTNNRGIRIEAFIAHDDEGNPILTPGHSWQSGLEAEGYIVNNDTSAKRLIWSDNTCFDVCGDGSIDTDY